MTYKFVVLLSFAVLSTSTFADTTDNPDMLQLLQEDMQEYSQLATQTRQNVDYMPYIISAWNSDELDRLGISTLRDALDLVPGVDLSIGTVGTTTPIFRGSNPFAMGQSKLVVDGVVVNDKMTGTYSQFLDMPVGMIHRIEIVRGPGSLLSHVNGYAGSIHVITKGNRDDGLAGDNEIFAEVGSNELRTGGFVLSHSENDVSITSDLFYKTHDQALPVSVDRFGNGGESAEWLDNYSFGINANYDAIRFKARLSEKESGPSYGQAFSLSEDYTDFVLIENNFIELGYTHEISNDIKLDLSIGYIELTRNLQNKVVPDGGSIGPTTFPDGRYFLVDIDEETFYEKIEFNINSIKSHRIIAGIYAYQSDMAKAEGRFSVDDLQTISSPSDLLIDTPRDMYSLYFDDLIDLSESTSMQFGIKYDNYSDVSNQTSPRLALVHRYDDENIYKIMYTSSYREPSWREQYLSGASFFSADINVQPETVDAFEFSYVHKMDLESYLKINTFYLKNKDQIHAQNPTHTFQNNGDNDLYGLKLEYRAHITSDDHVYFNYSYVDGENVGDVLASSASHIAKAYYTHELNSSLSVSALAKFVGDKSRIELDSRDEVDSYTLFDLAVNYKHKASATDVNLSIKNLFDETYYLPSPENTYPDDFEREGRSILLSVKKRF